ncbi:hypothetical protein [Nocardia sp. NPDC051570]|uniref:hypothetical protein n=1 Tax=Nocardia sp. NPDC051570 TaxID=3364324 RepID=UPI0037B31AA8
MTATHRIDDVDRQAFKPNTSQVHAVEDQVRALVRRMGVHQPLGIRQLIERYSEFTGTLILLQERLLPVDCFFAITLKLTSPFDAYAITYQQATSSWHQDHGIAHELGHIISGHYDSRSGTCHFDMSAHMEWEAEFCANLLGRWTYQLGRAMDRTKDLRPLLPLADVSAPLRERMGWL